MLPFLDLARPSRAALIVYGGRGLVTVSFIQPERQSSVSVISMMVTVCFHRCFSWDLQGEVCMRVTVAGAGDRRVFFLR